MNDDYFYSRNVEMNEAIEKISDEIYDDIPQYICEMLNDIDDDIFWKMAEIKYTADKNKRD